MADQLAGQDPPRGGAEDRSLLIVDDDAPLRRRLERAMEQRGYVVTAVDSVAAGVAGRAERVGEYAVFDAGDQGRGIQLSFGVLGLLDGFGSSNDREEL